MEAEGNKAEKIVLSRQQKIDKYSSNLAKRGLKLANTLSRYKVESFIQEPCFRVWKCKFTLPGYSKEVTFSGGKTLITWGDNESVAISQDNNFIASVDGWGEVKVWNLLEEKHIYSFKCECAEAIFPVDHWMHNFSSDLSAMGKHHSIYILPDNETAVCISDSGINAWNLKVGRQKYFFSSGSSSFSIDPKYQKIAICHSHNVEIMSCMTGQVLQTIDLDDDRSFFTENIAISPDSKLIVVSGSSLLDWGENEQGEEYYTNEHTIEIWDSNTGRLLYVLDRYIDYKNEKSSPHVVITSDGKNLISYSDWLEEGDAKINVWNLDTTELLYSISEAVYSVIVSSDEKLVYDSVADKKIKILDLDSGNLQYALIEESDSITTMTISADSSYLVCGTRSGTVQIRDLKTGDLLHTLAGHEHPVKSVVLSHNGEIIVSTDVEGTAKIWRTK
ncbi:hypothetical protein HJG54_27550 [Leptolyngbya sp. NK1-12]|uniref:WD40 repeat domain-containing protein n=1 Tax=Leptolyngbya sp. NK1-12 TaxID=2547451 RepID=A0AA96WIW6_9CYAN|nr:hypothetical protein [Leptolyngbya sp. NK1-12]WNZ26203.1 hypothetical protein HJG54_27550 [Leptolyngbya sp. NK1-12]